MAKAKIATVFFCQKCGYESSKWMGQCPGCREWNTFVEEQVVTGQGKSSRMKTVTGFSEKNKPAKLSEVSIEKEDRISTGIGELDRVLGGGIVAGSLTLVGGDPGIGKSTLLLQVCRNLAGDGREVLYVSGEESLKQIKLRANRIGTFSDHLKLLCETDLESIEETIRRSKPEVVIIDSIQTMFHGEISAAPGSISQVREATGLFLQLAKGLGVSIFIVGHVTKEGTVAGPRVLEHMVDTVLYFENAESGMRMLRAAKSRFGSVDEIGLFEMTEKGLLCVKDASRYFLSARSDGDLPSGIAFTPVIEGSRTFVVEVQALAVPARSGYQRIYSDKVDMGRVNRIAAILERHAGLDLSQDDIYVNVAGGMKLKEGSVDLALALALYSSKTDTPLPSTLASFGELSLAGEVRPVTFSSRRVKTLSDMGFSKIIVSQGTENEGSADTIKTKDIRSAVIAAFKGAKKSK